MIFFSDPSSEQAFGEEIQGAINSGLSFYSYRQPGDMMVSFGSSEGFLDGIGTPGFVIGMFNPEESYVTIPYKGCKRNSGEGMIYEYPAKSTSFQEYETEFNSIQKKLESIGEGKIVATRVITIEEKLDIGATFYALCRKFPEAYVFCFGTPIHGCWIGASPELLLKGEKGELKTMALAGTRPAGTISEWDEKNREEQAMVTDFIHQTFIKNSLSPQQETTYTKNAGAIEHICTPIDAILPSSGFKLEKLLKSLSPTPALSGLPRDLALDTIERTENFDRGCYGGFSGPYHFDGDFCFNVTLRCASVSERGYNVYAGGGITLKSSVKQEWEETEMKAEAFTGCAVSQRDFSQDFSFLD